MLQTTLNTPLTLALILLSCLATPVLPEVVGGWEAVDASTQAVKEAALKALKLYPDSNTWDYPQQLIQVIEAKQQVVAGVNYDLRLKVGVGACSRPYGAQGFDQYDQDCYFEKVGVCRFEIFVQIWSDTFELNNANCDDFVSAWESIALNHRVVEESTAVSLRRLQGSNNNNNNSALLYRLDQALRNTLTTYVFKLYSRITFKCPDCPDENASRALFTVRSDSRRHVMTRCEVDNQVVADNTACIVISAFPY